MTLIDTGKEVVRPYYLRWLYFRLFPARRPPHFDACWNFPFDRLPDAPSIAVQVREELPGVVLLPMNDWHSRFQRTQHLARNFVRLGYRAAYANPHFGRQCGSSHAFDPSHRLSAIEDNLFEVHPRLPSEPVFHERVLTRAESERVAEALQQTCRVLRMPHAIQLVSFPVWMEAAERLRDRLGFPIVYDCHDELSGFGNIAAELVAAEHRALGSADLNVFSSDRLFTGNLERDPSIASKSILVRNGVDAGSFPPASRATANRVVYAGALESWFDAAALTRAAERNPDAQFILAGRIDSEHLRSLESRPNVRFLGEVPYSSIPELLAGSRVGIIPFCVDRLTLGTNPIKMYEYFACGLPVAATRLPEIETFRDLVYFGSTPDEFALAVTHALAEDDAGKRERRRRIAASESWASRVEAIRSALLSREI